MPKNTKQTFNQKVAELDNIISKLESGDLELEEVDKLVTRGLQLLSETRNQLKSLELKITKILKEEK